MIIIICDFSALLCQLAMKIVVAKVFLTIQYAATKIDSPIISAHVMPDVKILKWMKMAQ